MRCHAGQTRKGTSIPYVAHLLAVASIALEHGADEDEAIGALLHDAVEDEKAELAEIRSRFGDRSLAGGRYPSARSNWTGRQSGPRNE